MPSTATPAVARYAAALRYELSERNQAYAKTHELKHQVSYGSQPVVCYEPDGAQRIAAQRPRLPGASSTPPTAPTRC